MSGGWHIARDGTALTLARPGRARFDLAAVTRLPGGRPAVLAHEIRKDVWRALRGLRGFSPAVRIEADRGGLAVTAGGAVMGRAWPRSWAEAQLAAVLADPARRARWVAHAGRGTGAARQHFGQAPGLLDTTPTGRGAT